MPELLNGTIRAWCLCSSLLRSDLLQAKAKGASPGKQIYCSAWSLIPFTPGTPAQAQGFHSKPCTGHVGAQPQHTGIGFSLQATEIAALCLPYPVSKGTLQSHPMSNSRTNSSCQRCSTGRKLTHEGKLNGESQTTVNRKATVSY